MDGIDNLLQSLTPDTYHFSQVDHGSAVVLVELGDDFGGGWLIHFPGEEPVSACDRMGARRWVMSVLDRCEKSGVGRPDIYEQPLATDGELGQMLTRIGAEQLRDPMGPRDTWISLKEARLFFDSQSNQYQTPVPASASSAFWSDAFHFASFGFYNNPTQGMQLQNRLLRVYPGDWTSWLFNTVGWWDENTGQFTSLDGVQQQTTPSEDQVTQQSYQVQYQQV